MKKKWQNFENLYVQAISCFEFKDIQINARVATVREKYLENKIFSRSGNCQGILWMAREI